MSAGPAPDAFLGTLLDGGGVGVAVVDREGRYRFVNRRMAAINGVSPEDHIGSTMSEVLPEMAGSIEPQVRRVLETGEQVLSVVVAGSTAAEKDRHWQASYVPLEWEGGPAVGCVVIDVTDRYEAEAETQRRVRQNMVIADLGQRALRADDVDDLLFRAAEAVRDELQADFSGVLFYARDREHLVMRAGAGFPPGAVGSMTAEAGHGSMAGYTLLADGPVLTPDVDAEERYTFTNALRAQGVRSAISTPIPGELAPGGVLGVLSRTVGHFGEADTAFVRAAAHVIGAAIQHDDQRRRLQELAAQRGRLVAQALEAGEREQRQVADVLHDDVLQHLLFATQELDGDDPAAITRARDSVQRASELVRSVAASMHPVTLSHAGLTVAVERVASEHAERGNLRVDAVVDPEAEGAEDRLLISLVRELLNNVVKHAGATRADVVVRVEGDGIALDVVDDGCGIGADVVTEAAQRGNLGLAYGRERVEALGGTMHVGAGTGGGGTAVSVVLPRRRLGTAPSG